MTGFKELEQSLKDLPNATRRNVLVRTATKAMKPMEEQMAALAPIDPLDRDGDGRHLNETIRTQTVTGKRVRAIGGLDRSKEVAVMTGPAPIGKRARANAGWQEYGTVKMAAQSYARPAADARSGEVIDNVREDLGQEITRAATRMAAKAARGR